MKKYSTTLINSIVHHPAYTANVCRDLQGLCGVFLQYLQGKSCNICRFSLQFLQSVRIAGKICKYSRFFPADIAENPRRVPVNPCKHLQCSNCGKSHYVQVILNDDKCYTLHCLSNHVSLYFIAVSHRFLQKNEQVKERGAK